jgi:hypothetical protein
MSLAQASAAPAGSATPTATAPPRPASLDALAAADPAALAALYAGARTPVLEDMDGPLVGRMLAVTVLPRFLAGLLRWFAALASFPWRGKTFTYKEGGRGEGINRVFGDRKPRTWFRFDTFVAPSRAGAFDAVQLDYDNPGNPGFIRAIKDEVREVAPGLYLGLAYFMLRGRPRLVLYFGLQKR